MNDIKLTNNNKNDESKSVKMKKLKQLIRQTIPAILMLFVGSTMLYAQNGITVSGSVIDNTGEPLIGASVVVKGQTSLGTVTDIDGNFRLKVPSEQSVLVFSYVGMTSKEIKVGKQRELKVSLLDDTQLEEVVVVGYGQQKKASVVGAITQTTGEVLERAAGIGSVGAALTGNLPGVATIASTGRPGEEDPRIYIRGAAAWGGVDCQPLILVDGVKRDIQSVDVTSVATVSVLKDASATAVYGVEGANGVILITTKRGQEGKARIDIGFNATLKAVSKLPRKYDSYDGYMLRNEAIEHELAIGGDASWEYFRPQTFIDLFRNQETCNAEKDPKKLVMLLSERKAMAVLKALESGKSGLDVDPETESFCVIGCDTLVYQEKGKRIVPD